MRWVKATNLRVVRITRAGWPNQGGRGRVCGVLLVDEGGGGWEGGARPDGGGGGDEDEWGAVGLLGESRNLVGLRRPRRMGVMEGMRYGDW